MVEAELACARFGNHSGGAAVEPGDLHGRIWTARCGLFDGRDLEEAIVGGDLTVHIRVNDPDFDVNPAGEDSINADSADGFGPVKVSVLRGSSTVILTYAGGDAVVDGRIGVGDGDSALIRDAGPIAEIAPDAGISIALLTAKSKNA